MANKIQRPRGTQDLQGRKLEKLQEIIKTVKRVFSNHGYTEVQTPMFESSKVFEENDALELGANKEFFYIKDRKESEEEEDTHSCVLKPEHTSSVIRAAIENKWYNRQVNYPLRYFYCGPCFRYERPQKGRFREFTQLGIEKINATSIWDDIENIKLMEILLLEFKLDLELRINYFGSKETKLKWTQALKEYFFKYRHELSEKSQQRINVNPFRILDDACESQKKVVRDAPKIDDFFTEEERSNKSKVLQALDEFVHDYCWDERLVRGIDYYTGLIYEWVDPKTDLTIAAGGRYDELFSRFDHENVPSVGLAIGLERLCMILDSDENNSFSWEKKEVEKIVLFSSSPMDEMDFFKKCFEIRSWIFGEYKKEGIEFRNFVDEKLLIISDYSIKNIDSYAKKISKNWNTEYLNFIDVSLDLSWEDFSTRIKDVLSKSINNGKELVASN